MAGITAKEEKTTSGSEIRLYYCSLCGKDFVSGRALGGHMSSRHPQSKTLKGPQPKPAQEKKDKMSPEDSHGNTCPQCGRQFQTAKAVHGHMRSHPGREWRGMNPPSPPKCAAVDCSKAGESHDEGDSSIDAESCGSVLGWGLTGRRGRKATKVCPPVAPVEVAVARVEVKTLHRVINLQAAATATATATATADQEVAEGPVPKKCKHDWDLNVAYSCEEDMAPDSN